MRALVNFSVCGCVQVRATAWIKGVPCNTAGILFLSSRIGFPTSHMGHSQQLKPALCCMSRLSLRCSSPLRCCGPGHRRSKQTPCFAWLRPHLRRKKPKLGNAWATYVAVAVAVMFDPRLKGFLTRASRAMRFETRRYCGSYPAGSLLWF